MKKVLFTVAIAAFAFTANAQKGGSDGMKFGAGISAGLPIGTGASLFYSFAAGVDIMAEFPASDAVAITGSAGYLNYFGKNGLGSTGLIPVLVGGKFGLGESMYGHLQAGVTFGTQSGSGTLFTYAPSIGYKAGEKLDIAVRYMGFAKTGSIGNIGVRVGFSF